MKPGTRVIYFRRPCGTQLSRKAQRLPATVLKVMRTRTKIRTDEGAVICVESDNLEEMK